MINVKDLRLKYGANTKALNFNLDAGTITWLKGKNGAGKSTLLLTLMGFETAISGQITNPKGVNTFSYAPQKPDFNFGLSVRRVLELAQVARDSKYVTELGLEDVLDTAVTKLSGGETQRVNLAIAFNKSADYLLLDEPFASQDESSIARIKKMIQEKRSAGSAILIASHIEVAADQVLELI